MRPIKFWRMEIQQLSASERIGYQKAIKQLLNWDILKKECFELDLIERILESEMNVEDMAHLRNGTRPTVPVLPEKRVFHAIY